MMIFAKRIYVLTFIVYRNPKMLATTKKMWLNILLLILFYSFLLLYYLDLWIAIFTETVLNKKFLISLENAAYIFFWKSLTAVYE